MVPDWALAGKADVVVLRRSLVKSGDASRSWIAILSGAVGSVVYASGRTESEAANG
jgi:hypothetical protein